MRLSVVVPAYNEARRILPSLERIFSYLDAHHPDYEVLLVNDGSSDDTAAVVQRRFGDRPQLQLLSYGSNRGKGYAVRLGAQRAQGDVMLFSDADLSTPVEEMEKMLPLIEQGYDLVIGSRAHERAEIRERQPFFREAAGKLFNLMVRLVVRLPFHDTQCGFKLFRREPMLAVWQQLHIDRFAFDVELIAVALAAGLKVAEVPVVWINSPPSTVGFWQGAQAFVDLWEIRRRARRLMAERVVSGDRAAAQPRVR